MADPDGASSSASFLLTVNPVNDPPTLDPIANLQLNENAGLQTITLTGISSGSDAENQPLSVAASSSNPALIPNPTVNYASPDQTGTLSFIPAANFNGTATINVTVNDGQASNNIVTRMFTVTVNDSPRISSIPTQTDNEDTSLAIAFTVRDTETPASNLVVAASSSDISLVPNQNLRLSGNQTNRTLTITPASNQFGSALITVSVTDPNNATASETFALAVNAVNDPPTLDPIADLTLYASAGPQTVTLTGITAGPANENQTVSVSATSGNPSLVPNPTVNYSPPDPTATLTLVPSSTASGTALITVTAKDDGGTLNAGQDESSRTFVVTVTRAPALRITRANNLLVLSWPTNAAGLQLESANDVTNEWSPVAKAPTVVGGQNFVTNTLTGSRAFFRLHTR